MKVTLTERGTEYLKEMMYDSASLTRNDALNARHVTMPKEKADKGLASILLKASASRFATGKQGNNAHLVATQLLESIVPAIMASNVPKKVAIKIPRISLSPRLRERYLRESSANSNGLSLPNIVRMPETNKTANEYYSMKKDEEDKLYKTLQRFRAEKTSQRLLQVKSMAAALMTKSMKRNRLILLKAGEADKSQITTQRPEPKSEVNTQDDAARLISKVQPFVDETFERRTGREWYKNQILAKHSKMEGMWQKKERLQKLSAPFARKVSMPIIKNNNII